MQNKNTVKIVFPTKSGLRDSAESFDRLRMLSEVEALVEVNFTLFTP